MTIVTIAQCFTQTNPYAFIFSQDYMQNVHGKEIDLLRTTVKIPGKRPPRAVATVAPTASPKTNGLTKDRSNLQLGIGSTGRIWSSLNCKWVQWRQLCKYKLLALHLKFERLLHTIFILLLFVVLQFYIFSLYMS